MKQPEEEYEELYWREQPGRPDSGWKGISQVHLQRTRKQWSLLRASSNADIIDTVQLINESSDRIEKAMSGNTERIDERSKNIDVAFAEMKETENKMCEM